MSQNQISKQRLVLGFLQFLKDEVKAESANPEKQESLEVAVQCLETVYGVSLNNAENKATYGPTIDLLGVVTDITSSPAFASWMDASQETAPTEPLTDDMRQQADKLKNEGNDLVKQEKYKEALEAYNAAIKIDGNNAIYYCNRAAAHNKLGNNEQALNDCFRSLQIDPNYSKSYGRLGVIYLSLDQPDEALEAYKQALALEPNNENYKQSVKICEDRLNSLGRTTAGATGGPGFPPMFGSLFSGGMGGMGGFGGLGAGGPPDMMSILNNPSLMNMAMQFVQNPEVQGLMANLVNNLGGQEGGDTGLETLLQTGQRMASELSAHNPELVETLRRNMGNQSLSDNDNSAESTNPDNNNSNDKQPPPSS